MEYEKHSSTNTDDTHNDTQPEVRPNIYESAVLGGPQDLLSVTLELQKYLKKEPNIAQDQNKP